MHKIYSAYHDQCLSKKSIQLLTPIKGHEPYNIIEKQKELNKKWCDQPKWNGKTFVQEISALVSSKNGLEKNRLAVKVKYECERPVINIIVDNYHNLIKKDLDEIKVFDAKIM